MKLDMNFLENFVNCEFCLCISVIIVLYFSFLLYHYYCYLLLSAVWRNKVEYITTSGWLAAILNFRHEVASAIIAGDLDVSYIVINSCCIVFGTTYICRTSKVIGTSGNSAAILDFWRTSTSHETRSTTIRKFDHENMGVAVRVLCLIIVQWVDDTNHRYAYMMQTSGTQHRRICTSQVNVFQRTQVYCSVVSSQYN